MINNLSSSSIKLHCAIFLVNAQLRKLPSCIDIYCTSSRIVSTYPRVWAKEQFRKSLVSSLNVDGASPGARFLNNGFAPWIVLPQSCSNVPEQESADHFLHENSRIAIPATVNVVQLQQ